MSANRLAGTKSQPVLTIQYEYIQKCQIAISTLFTKFTFLFPQSNLSILQSFTPISFKQRANQIFQICYRLPCVHLQSLSMPPKPQAKDEIKSKINIETSGTITDFQYNHNGSKLAVADSQGYLFVYERANEGFSQVANFRGDEAAIWKLAWADPSFGDTIAIGTFKRKVAVFQLRNAQWTEIAYHELHQGSVNQVEWASPAFGCKLFSAGSEGAVAILQLKKNNWVSSHFYAHECSISSLSVRPLALNMSEEKQREYPMIATAAKDSSVKIWRHTSEISEDQLQNEARIYQHVAVLKPHKQMVRGLLWKKRWCETIPIQYELLTCSEDGLVKQTSFVADKEHKSVIVCQHESPIFRISQSLTGNLLTVSLGSQQSFLYGERQGEGEWQYLQQLK